MENKAYDTAWNMAESLRETSQAITDTAIAAQERNMQFIQNTLESGVDVFKSMTENTRSIMQDVAESPAKPQESFKAIVDKSAANQEKAIRYTQQVYVNGLEVLKSQAERTASLTQLMMGQTQRQMTQFQSIAQQTGDMYLRLLGTPLSLYKQVADYVEANTK